MHGPNQLGLYFTLLNVNTTSSDIKHWTKYIFQQKQLELNQCPRMKILQPWIQMMTWTSLQLISGLLNFVFHSAHVLHLKEVEKWFMLASCVPMAAVL